jgi:putative phosphoribosyl transferase
VSKHTHTDGNTGVEQMVQIAVDEVQLEGMLELPPHAHSMVLFAHGSGSSRHSPRNNYVAKILRDHGIGTLLLDLLTPQEDVHYQTRFDIALLTHRLRVATRWVVRHDPTRHLPIGYFGASTGAAAALQAAAALGDGVRAVVSRGGRPDLAGSHELAQVRCPTLLLVGGLDGEVIRLNREACEWLPCTKELTIIPGATHLFEEPGALEEVALLATGWFEQHLKP